MAVDIEIVTDIPESPHRYNRKVDWDAVRKAVEAQPGAWAKVGPIDQSVATHIKAGRYLAFPDPERFEIQTRRAQPDEVPDEEAGKTRAWIYIRLRP